MVLTKNVTLGCIAPGVGFYNPIPGNEWDILDEENFIFWVE